MKEKACVTLPISGAVDFKARNIIRNKKRWFIIINGSIQQEDTTILNLYAPSGIASK